MFRSLADGLEGALHEGTITPDQAKRILELSEKRPGWAKEAALLIGLVLTGVGVMFFLSSLYRLLSVWSVVGVYIGFSIASLAGGYVTNRRGLRAVCLACCVAAVIFTPLALHGLWNLAAHGFIVHQMSDLGTVLSLDDSTADLGVRLWLFGMGLAVSAALSVHTKEPLMAEVTTVALWQTALTVCRLAHWNVKLSALSAMIGAAAAAAALVARKRSSGVKVCRIWDEFFASGAALFGGSVNFWLSGPYAQGVFPWKAASALLFNAAFAMAAGKFGQRGLVLLGAIGLAFHLCCLADFYLPSPYGSLAIILIGAGVLILSIRTSKGR